MEKARDFQLFMTTEDEMLFCKALKEFNHNILFLDTKPTTDCDISKKLVECVTHLPSTSFSIVNFDLINKEELSKRYEQYGDYFNFHCIGRAQMQFLRSHPDGNVKDCLQHGRIADSYSPEDEEEKKWKNKVYSILKKLGYGVYWYYKVLPDGIREIAVKPQNRLVALPDAIEKYNGKNGNFMIHNRAKFVPAGVTLNDIKILETET